MPGLAGRWGVSPVLRQFGPTPEARPLGPTLWSYWCDIEVSETEAVRRIVIADRKSSGGDGLEAELVSKPRRTAAE